MIKTIESRQNQKIKDLLKLSNTKVSKEQRLFKIEGFHALEMAKKSGALLCVFTTKEIKDLDVLQYLVSKDIMETISSAKSPQGVVCLCSYLEEKPIKSNKVLMLDDKIGAPYVKGAKVTGKVLAQGKAKKIIVYKYKSKKNYHKKQGHRQPFTKIQITSIEG